MNAFAVLVDMFPVLGTLFEQHFRIQCQTVHFAGRLGGRKVEIVAKVETCRQRSVGKNVAKFGRYLCGH